MEIFQEMKKKLCGVLMHIPRSKVNKQNFTYTFLSHTDIMLGTGRKVLGGGRWAGSKRGWVIIFLSL